MMIKFNHQYLVSMFFASFVLLGCTTPEALKSKLHQYLSQQCFDLFTDSALGYSHLAGHPVAGTTFAIAGDKNKQVCAWASTRDSGNSYRTMEFMALGKCEDLRVKSGITSPCKIFAKNFDIVIDEKKTHGME